MLINSLSKLKIFKIFLFTHKKNNSEYEISKDIKRIIIPYEPIILKKYLLKKKINIFIYQLYSIPMIKMLKSLKNVKIIFYMHSCFLYWVYIQYFNIFRFNYNEYANSDYIISIIPFENDFIFKKWGINSIYMNNFLTYNYDKIIPSDLSSSKILMIGRADDKDKRFELGVHSMKYIIKENSQSQMIILSKDNGLSNLKKIIESLNLGKNIKFTGYTNTPEIYFKNSSLFQRLFLWF
jgi:glycosyltransferase involved in cell wall biosynthesis